MSRAGARRRRTGAVAAGVVIALCAASATAVGVTEEEGMGAAQAAWATAPSDARTSTFTAAARPAEADASATGWTAEDAHRYWTPERMAAATPAEATAPRSAGPALPEAAAPRSAGAQLAPNAQHFDGIPSVGVLFSVGKDAKAHHCTASVVRSPRRDLILTAGHCNPGPRAAFVPQYRSGADPQPYGIWAVGRAFADPRRTDTGPGSDLDFAFATVAPDAKGRPIEAVTGGNVLTPTPGYTNRVTVIGYPSVRHDPADRAVRCTTDTTRLPGRRQLRMECGGFYGGTSGGPWLTGFDARTRTGRVIGVIGGLNGGGPTGPDNHRTSYSPVLWKDAFRLYARASAATRSAGSAVG